MSGYVEHTHQVRWASEYALEMEAWIPVIAWAELSMHRYRDPGSVAGEAVALLRLGFGGHPLHKQADLERADCSVALLRKEKS